MTIIQRRSVHGGDVRKDTQAAYFPTPSDEESRQQEGFNLDQCGNLAHERPPPFTVHARHETMGSAAREITLPLAAACP